MTAPRSQTVTQPRKVSFILHFSRSAGSGWTGRMQEVECGRSHPFVCLESFVEELAAHGIALRHRAPGEEICEACHAALRMSRGEA